MTHFSMSITGTYMTDAPDIALAMLNCYNDLSETLTDFDVVEIS